MALQVLNIGTNEDGSPRLHYHDPEGHVVLTAPSHAGTVTLKDGTSYDVTPNVLSVASHEHALELAAKLSGVEVSDVVIVDVTPSTKKKG